MAEVRQDQVDKNSDTPLPLIFISHRHEDVELAEQVKSFVEDSTARAVKVFLSSALDSPIQGGDKLNKQLLSNLREAQVLLFLYTTDEADWSYCLWECGVVMNPDAPTTRVVVMECSDRAPGPFNDDMRINLRKEDDIKKFAIDLLTNTTFFPHLGEKAITRYQPMEKSVLEKAKSFYENVQKYLPPQKRYLYTDRYYSYIILHVKSEFIHDKMDLEHIAIKTENDILKKMFGLTPRNQKECNWNLKQIRESIIEGERNNMGEQNIAWIYQLEKSIKDTHEGRISDPIASKYRARDKNLYLPMLARHDVDHDGNNTFYVIFAKQTTWDWEKLDYSSVKLLILLEYIYYSYIFRHNIVDVYLKKSKNWSYGVGIEEDLEELKSSIIAIEQDADYPNVFAPLRTGKVFEGNEQEKLDKMFDDYAPLRSKLMEEIAIQNAKEVQHQLMMLQSMNREFIVMATRRYYELTCAFFEPQSDGHFACTHVGS